MALVLVALIALGSLSPASAIGPARRDRGPLFTTSEVVRTLDSDNFDAMLNDTYTVWLVDFYSPWCPHCRQFGPQWEEVANVYAAVDTVQLGAVDCTRQNDICDREDVHSYPGVKMYHVEEQPIKMPHAGHIYARHVAKWIEETLHENDMQSGIDIDEIYPKNPMRDDLKKKEFKFGDPVEPLVDDRSADIQLKRLKDAGTTALFTFEDGFFMGATVLEGERYDAAVMWVRALASSFPMQQNREAFTELVQEMKKRESWKKADWNDLITRWKITANAMSYPANLFVSKDDLALCTTFTCGLWTLFHTITVSDVQTPATLEQWKPSEIMSAIRLVVKHFFGCEECKRHFLKANPESLVRKLALRDGDGPHAVAFWIWTMHNTVNKVLNKAMWPTKLSCPNCYAADDQPLSLDPAQLNEEGIVAYIRSVYKFESKLALEQHAAAASPWLSAGGFASMAVVALLISIFATYKAGPSPNSEVRKAVALGHYPFVENHRVSMPDTEESSANEPHDSEITQVECFSDCSLSVGVHRFRTAVASLVMAGTLLVVMWQLAGPGRRLDSFKATDLDPAGQKQLLDNYNSVSGGLTALLMKPLDVFLGMVITVGCLCVAPSFSIYHENRRSALNVQVISAPIQPRISASDLAVENVVDNTQGLDTNGLVTTTWNTSFRESAAGNSVRNTILRNLFIPTERVPAWSDRPMNGSEDSYKYVIASYAFPARVWQKYALSQALKPTASLSMPMNAAPADLPPDDDLPLDGGVATNLVMHLILVSNGILGWWGRDDEAWNTDRYENRTGSLPMAEHFNLSNSSANKTLVRDSHKAIVDYFAKTKNASTTDELAKLEFSRVNLSDSVVFDALTVEIPTQMLDQSAPNTSTSASYFVSMCNLAGCLIEDVDEYKIDGKEPAKTTIYPRVQALAICLNDKGKEKLSVDFKQTDPGQVLQECKQRSYSSMIIVSIGKRIEGDEFVAEDWFMVSASTLAW